MCPNPVETPAFQFLVFSVVFWNVNLVADSLHPPPSCHVSRPRTHTHTDMSPPLCALPPHTYLHSIAGRSGMLLQQRRHSQMDAQMWRDRVLFGRHQVGVQATVSNLLRFRPCIYIARTHRTLKYSLMLRVHNLCSRV